MFNPFTLVLGLIFWIILFEVILTHGIVIGLLAAAGMVFLIVVATLAFGHWLAR